VKRWQPWEEAYLAGVCEEAIRQGLRWRDAAVTASRRLGRGVAAIEFRIALLGLFPRGRKGRARRNMAGPFDAVPDGVEPTVWGKPLSWFRPEGGNS